MSELREHTYHGITYLPCSWVGSKRWYRVCYHQTGIPWDERECPQFATLDECRQDAEETTSALLQPGNEVFWTDPDGGACSRFIQIAAAKIAGDVVAITDVNGDDLECFIHELS